MNAQFVDWWIEREQKIVDAFHKIPARHNLHMRDKTGEHLMQFFRPREPTEAAPDVAECFAEIRLAQNRRLPATKQQTLREIEAVKTRAQHLLKALSGLHQPAVQAIDSRPSRLDKIETELRVLIIKSSNIELPEWAAGEGLGRKKDDHSAMVALEVAKFYFSITGDRPTIITPPQGGNAYGPFLDLLADVFSIMDIDASPESQAKSAIIAMEKIYLKNSH